MAREAGGQQRWLKKFLNVNIIWHLKKKKLFLRVKEVEHGFFNPSSTVEECHNFGCASFKCKFAVAEQDLQKKCRFVSEASGV